MKLAATVENAAGILQLQSSVWVRSQMRPKGLQDILSATQRGPSTPVGLK